MTTINGVEIAEQAHRKEMMRILAVDDDLDTRLLMTRLLTKWGHEVLTASDGVEALELLKREHLQLVISDWLMPRMDGLELCRQIRGGSFPEYLYVIILTAKDTKGELITAMEAGADDYISKPFDKSELKVRIRAGERVIDLKQDLEDRNKRLIGALSTIRKDLEAAAKMQKDLLPNPTGGPSGFSFDWLFLPCSFVAGDTFHYLEIDDHHVCFYLLDVSGHGVPAAMLSFTLSKTLSSLAFPGNPLRESCEIQQSYDLVSPATAVNELNRRFQSDEKSMQYFTMIYGILDKRNGRIVFTQAGQPLPIHVPRGAPPRFIGSGGFPVGLYSEATYDEQEIVLQPGERLILYSDGITDCTNAKEEDFSPERLIKILGGWQDLPLRSLMGKLEQELREWRGGDEFQDDMTLLAIERTMV